MQNTDIAAVLEEIADLLEIEQANPFRIRAYRNAARYLRGMRTPVGELIAAGRDLTELPGIGADLAAKLREIVDTGSCRTLAQLRRSTPPSVADLLRIPGLGPKRVRALYHDLDVASVEQLARAVRDGRVRTLAGFGPGIERKIHTALAARTDRAGGARLARSVAAHHAEPLREYLARAPGVTEVGLAGSYRRARETIGDLDIVAASADPRATIERFLAYAEVRDVVARGPTRATVVLRSNLQVDLRVVAPESFGAALQYFTGSKAHNIAVRRLAQERDLKVNEYGVFGGSARTRRIAGATEESVYAALGLVWIPPELREDQGEIEAAAAGALPALVTRADLRGDLHAHTDATDGRDSLLDMAQAARREGLAYLAITEHSRRLSMAHGLDPARLRRQMHQIDALNRDLDGFTLLKGIEVDILADGTLDLPDTVLAQCDVVVAAVHSHFDWSRARQTERILKAIEHPLVSILAHPTGRLIERREPYDVDMLQVIRKARACGCHLELNAHPMRLDLLDVHCRMAKDEGVLVAISSDAHGVEEFANLADGVNQARRGWLGAADVLNTRALEPLRGLLRNAKASQRGA